MQQQRGACELQQRNSDIPHTLTMTTLAQLIFIVTVTCENSHYSMVTDNEIVDCPGVALGVADGMHVGILRAGAIYTMAW